MAFVTIKDKDNATLGHLQTDAQERLGIHNLLHVQDQKPLGTNGGTFTSGAWRTRDLNTVLVNNIAGASLSNNRITLPSGIYFIDAKLTVFSGHSADLHHHKARLYDVSNGLSIMFSDSRRIRHYNYEGSDTASFSGGFTLNGEAIVEISHFSMVSVPDVGFGSAGSLGENETYSDVKIWKLA